MFLWWDLVQAELQCYAFRESAVTTILVWHPSHTCDCVVNSVERDFLEDGEKRRNWSWKTKEWLINNEQKEWDVEKIDRERCGWEMGGNVNLFTSETHTHSLMNCSNPRQDLPPLSALFHTLTLTPPVSKHSVTQSEEESYTSVTTCCSSWSSTKPGCFYISGAELWCWWTDAKKRKWCIQSGCCLGLWSDENDLQFVRSSRTSWTNQRLHRPDHS